jgi:hypothetical protein
MHHSVIGMARIPLRGATQPLGPKWGFETTSSERLNNIRVEGNRSSIMGR